MTEKTGPVSNRRILKGNDGGLEALVREYGDSLVRFAYCFVKDSATEIDRYFYIFSGAEFSVLPLP